MTNFPSPMAVPGPDSMAPGRLMPETDNSSQALAAGISNLARGVARGAAGLDDVATRQKAQEDTVDIARAEAFKTSKFYDIQNKFAQDGDYSTFNERAAPMVGDALDKAGGLIRDDRVRERWLAQSEDSKLAMMQAIHERGQGLKQDAEKTALVGSMDNNAKLMSDPSVPRAVRDKARMDIQGTLFMGEKTGLLKPSESAALRKKTIDQADNQLAINLAETDILSDPQRVMTGMAIPTQGAGNSILDAQTTVDGTTPQLEFSMAKMTAQLMGDANFPDDPKLAAAYLSDPEKALDYAEAAQMHLSDRYKGDLGAVVIAMDPNGGTAAADRWVASGHKDSVLPDSVSARYHKVMAGITAEQPYQRIPLQAAPGVDLGTIDPGVLDRYEQLQSHFGMALPVIQPDQSQHLGANAVSIDVSGLNTDQRSKLIEMASSMGFNGIGVGKDSLSFDTGTLRAWGPDGKGPDTAVSNFDASKAPGLLEPGNIDVNHRQVVHNADGGYSTEYSTSFDEDGKEVLVPTVFDGAHHTEDEAIQHYRETGQHLGKFDTVADADAYAEKLHSRKQSFEQGSIPTWASDAIDQHLSGTVQPVPALYSGVSPEYANLTYDQRLQLYGKAKAEMNNRDVGLRSSLATVADNAPAAFASTGKYDGPMPTANDFVKAYGGSEGIQRFQAFESDLDTSKTVFGMRTMPSDDINAAVKASIPVSTGNTAAIEQKRYQAIATAAASVLKARADDPAGYTLDAYPQVAAAFDAAGKDHTLFPQALTAMAEAQKQLGITEPELLPKSMAVQAASAFKDATLPAQQRIAAVAGTVLATTDVGQQDAIFNQLVKEGLPPMLSGALDAMRRGDAGGSSNLMRAALFDPSKMKTDLPQGQKPADIQSALQEQVFAPGQIGDITYGVAGGSSDNLESAGSASQLMFNDVTLHLTDGSAGGDLGKAIDLAKKDMFGDVQVLTGAGGFMGMGAGTGIKVTIPKNADPNMARAGFNALTPHVRDQLKAFALSGMMAGPVKPAQALAAQWSLDNYADAVMSEGYFTNGDGFLPAGQKGFVFYNPKENVPVYGPDGKPVMFSMGDVLGAGNPQASGGGF